MQFCPNPKALYGAGRPFCRKMELVWFTLQSSWWLRCTSQRASLGLHVHCINWFPQHFYWRLAFFWTCRVHSVIAFDCSLALNSMETEGEAEMRIVEEKLWRGYQVTDGPQGLTRRVSFWHRAVMRTHWGDLKAQARDQLTSSLSLWL